MLDKIKNSMNGQIIIRQSSDKKTIVLLPNHEIRFYTEAEAEEERDEKCNGGTNLSLSGLTFVAQDRGILKLMAGNYIRNIKR